MPPRITHPTMSSPFARTRCPCPQPAAGSSVEMIRQSAAISVAAAGTSAQPHSFLNTPTTLPNSIVDLKSLARTSIGAICELAGWNRM